jgi:hypothetical protein
MPWYARDLAGPFKLPLDSQDNCFFLDTGGFDGKQARTRRQIDELKRKAACYEQEHDALPEAHPKRAWYQERLAYYRGEIERC